MSHSEHVKQIGQSMPAIGNFIETMGTREGKRCHFFAIVWVDGVAQHVANTPSEGVEHILRDHLQRIAVGQIMQGAAR